MTKLGTMLVLASTLFVIASLPTKADARESTCPDTVKPQTPIPGAHTDTKHGRIIPVSSTGTPLESATLTMEFGLNRDRAVRTQTYRVSGGIDPDAVRVSTVNDFVRGNEALPISNGQLTYHASTNPGTGLVNVRVCYDPGGEKEPTPGRYIGSLLVSAPSAMESTLALQLTFQDDETWKPYMALIVGILGGLGVIAIAAYQQAPESTRPKRLYPYVFNLRMLVALVTGLVAAYAAYGKLVDSDPTWDDTKVTILALVGASFSATLAGKTVSDLKGPTDKEKDQGTRSS